MSFLRQAQIYQSDAGFFWNQRGRSWLRLRPRPHRLDESAAGYSLAGCSPAEPASASPASAYFGTEQPRRTIGFQRTAKCGLTGCLSRGVQSKVFRTGERQVILSTNVPTVITAANARNIILVQRIDHHSVVEDVGTGETNNLRILLAEMGSTLADLFGADHVLWVEGLTEELCIPRIVEERIGRPLMGTVIKGVRNTGDFTGWLATVVIEVYKKLSTSTSLVPPALGFFFDREEHTAQQQAELHHRADGRAFFTRRRMFENYLLHPTAIATVIAEVDEGRERPVTGVEVQEKLAAERGEVDEKAWVTDENGTEIMEKVFAELTDARVRYDKTKHGPRIAEWILHNAPEHFDELVEELRLIFGWTT